MTCRTQNSAGWTAQRLKSRTRDCRHSAQWHRGVNQRCLAHSTHSLHVSHSSVLSKTETQKTRRRDRQDGHTRAQLLCLSVGQHLASSTAALSCHKKIIIAQSSAHTPGLTDTVQLHHTDTNVRDRATTSRRRVIFSNDTSCLSLLVLQSSALACSDTIKSHVADD
jgi:hypothetical protein